MLFSLLRSNKAERTSLFPFIEFAISPDKLRKGPSLTSINKPNIELVTLLEISLKVTT